jgi:hypothetical protein
VKIVSFYHKDTGMLHGSQLVVSDDSLVKANTPTDHLPIDGHHDPLSKRVNIATGELMDYQPPTPSSEHEWNPTTKRWQLSAAAAERESKRSLAFNRIEHLENSQARALRELAVGTPAEKLEAEKRLQAAYAEIATLRLQL